MPRPEFEQVVAQAQKEELITTLFKRTDPMASNTFFEYVLFSPVNTIAKLVSIRIDVPQATGSTAGDIWTTVLYDITDGDLALAGQNLDLVQGLSHHNAPTKFNKLYFEQANKEQRPSDFGAQVASIKHAEFDDKVGLVVNIQNNTDSVINGPFYISITTINRQIAK